jgi:hypothetical protein
MQSLLLLQLKTSTSLPDLFSPKLVGGMMVVVVVPFANVVIIFWPLLNGRGMHYGEHTRLQVIFKHFHSISLESKAL